MEANRRDVPKLERSFSQGFARRAGRDAPQSPVSSMPALRRQAASTSTFTETVRGLGPGAAALFASKAFKAMSQEQKLKTFIDLGLHQLHLAPEGKKEKTVPGMQFEAAQQPRPAFPGPDTREENLMVFAADAFLEAGGLGGFNNQAWNFNKKPPKPLPMKQAANGLRHLSHEEMAGLKNQSRNQETCQQLYKKGWVQQPFRVIRGMDYMYNQHQAKVARTAQDAREAGEEEEGDIDVAASRHNAIEEKLRNSTFFKDMERQKKGIIEKLAKVSKVHEECEGQLIFRQGDQAASVYLLTHGSVAVLVRDVEPGTPRRKDVKSLSTLTQVQQVNQLQSRPSAWEDRPQEPDRSDSRSRRAEISEMSAKIRAKIAPKQQILRRDLSKSGQVDAEQVYATVEGSSSFSKDSKLGVQVNVVEAGSVFGEVALLSDAPRSASIKCLEPCEFVAVKAAVFRKVLAEFTDVARALGILQSVETFNRLEERTPGIIHTLAKTAEFSKESKGQVIFRQGDPGKSCFMLVKGQVTVHVRKGAKALWPQTPRMRVGEMPTLTEWRRTGLEAFDEAARREEKKYGRPSREEQSFRTTEGFSTFGKESNYGDMVNWLREGTLFGELALQNTEPRSATIVCSQDSELLRLRKEDYLSVIQGTKQKIYFFDRFLAPFRQNADKRASGALTQHPSLLFADEMFRDGQTLATEGVYADPKIFVLGAATTAEFCRYKAPGDNPAYVLSKRPQSAPNQKANRCQPLLPNDLERCQQDEEFRQSIGIFNPSGQEVVVYDVLKEGSIFSTMSASLNCSPEPFSIVARCPNETCTIYTLNGAGIQKMHPRLLEALRELLAEEGAKRMKKVSRDEKIQDIVVGSAETW